MPEYQYFSKIRNPEYDAKLWAQCRAFYAGGKTLLGDKKLLAEVFPRHLVEEEDVYCERVARAYYIPYAGEIIDAICAALFGEPVTVEHEEGDADEAFYEALYEDCSPPAGRKQSLNELLKYQVLTALLCRRAWTLVDLPDMPPDEQIPESLADEEALGLRSAYACPIDPEMVLDWEETEDGELLWALVLHREKRRAGLEFKRNLIREEYTYYTAMDWTRYAIEYKADKLPTDKTDVPEMDSGQHSFGRVPLVRLDLTDGLWAMGKILSIAIAHFNKRNALSWAEYKSLFPVLASFLGEEEVLNPATEDPNRDVNQQYGQGRVVRFGSKDNLKYVGPDSGPFMAAMQDLHGLRDEMHRVLHHMALSVENSAAALQRSAESKQVDRSATATILRALGQFVRGHVVDIYEMVALGRGEENSKPTASGMEKFNEETVDALMEQATVVDAVSIPSATFKQIWTYILARRLLGDNATEDDFGKIKTELEQNISNEDYMMPMEAVPEEEEEGEEEEEDKK